ncbi:MAG: thiamine-phosphate kinase [Nitrosomonadales bacterium]|nr:thiamine-phosphate kinase [Nitrosomonadales bacterium]
MKPSSSEFDLIKRYFTRPAPGAVLGVGDDAALLRVGNGMELAVSTDMLVSGTHFFPDADPFLLGHKTLAVNLSDLAAMGALPRWALLSLALPAADESWLERFSAGFFALADQHGVELVGGDTTRGPLNLCVTIMGEVPQGGALRRDGARAGDDIWVSGMLGRAALALAHHQGAVRLPTAELVDCTAALHQPAPRVALGLALRGMAHSAIDISDGLLADLGHILESSAAGAEIAFDALPVPEILRTLSSQGRGEVAQRCALAGGDDYELCFTVPVSRRSGVESISGRLNLPLTRIGSIVAGCGCIVRAPDGSAIHLEKSGYDHFR